jgi:hypothetical protein
MLTYGTPPLHTSAEFDHLHRHGWSWVVEYLDRLVVPDTGKETIVDVYLDTTFSKGREAFDRPWIGWVHHVWRKVGKDTMTHDLMMSESFRKSLSHCKAIFTFTERQATFWKSAFNQAGFSIPVKSLVHPTDLDVPKWNFNAFRHNPIKKVIQVGAWMRDPFSIYELGTRLPPGFKAVILHGPNMGDVHAPQHFIEKFKQFMESFPTSGGGGICRS